MYGFGLFGGGAEKKILQNKTIKCAVKQSILKLNIEFRLNFIFNILRK